VSDLTYFDIDGVLTDFVRVFQVAGERELGRELPVHREDSYSLRDQLELSTREHERIWRSPHLLDAMLGAPPMNHELESLVGAGRHCFITARGTSELERDHADSIRIGTRAWLRRHFVEDFSDIHFVPAEGKAQLALELGVRVAYEDHPQTALDLALAGIAVRMPCYDYNRFVLHRLITPIEGWREPSLFDLLGVS